MQAYEAPEVLDIKARDIDIRFWIANGRLRVWASRFEEIEPELLDLMDALPEGSVFYDIGASIGLFSLYAGIARKAKVYAFEAEAQNYATLEMNTMLNRDRLSTPVTAMNLAISDCVGLGHIHTRVYGAGEHGKILDQAISQDTKEGFQPEHIQAALKLPLDQIISMCGLPFPQVIKIDVDGAEAAVLRGAKTVLDCRDLHTIFIEISERSSTSEIRLLEESGFSLAKKFPVVRLSGGFYPELYNCIYQRS